MKCSSMFLAATTLMCCCLLRWSSGSSANDGDSLEENRRLKILVHSLDVGFSHLQFQCRVADVLAEAGHEVHLLVQEVRESNNMSTVDGRWRRRWRQPPPARLSYEDNILHTDPFAGPHTFIANDHFYTSFMEIVIRNTCYDITHNRDLLASLTAERFDVAIAEFLDPCIFAVFHRLGVPTILATTAVQMNSLYTWQIGLPHFSSYMPTLFSAPTSAPQMNFWERAINFYNLVYQYYISTPAVFRAQNHVIRHAFGADFPPLRSIMRNISLVFINSSPFLELPMPLSNKIIHIGGIVDPLRKDSSTAATNPLDSEVQTLLDDPTIHDVVLFSFGTLADTRRMRDDMRNAFLDAFASLPHVHFVWKFVAPANTTTVGRLPTPKNVHIFEWLDQKRILAHPKCKAFISHCGLNSLNEAAANGVPMVAVPLFADQSFNSAVMRANGLGRVLDARHGARHAGSIADALRAVLAPDSPYRRNARMAQRKKRALPFRADEQLQRWVEFAARFPGESFAELNLPDADDFPLGDLQMYNADVVAVSLAAALAIAVLVAVTMRVAWRWTIGTAAAARRMKKVQ